MARGEKNAYWCPKCHGYTITIDVDKGVTPMFLACRASGDVGTCDGMAQSMVYPPEPWPIEDGYENHIPTEPQFEWYAPDAIELVGLRLKSRAPGTKKKRRLAAASLEHVNKGGLLLRPVASV